MNQLARIYFDFLTNVFIYLTTYTLTKEELKIQIPRKRHIYCILLYVLFSLPEKLPYHNLISNFFSILIILIISYPHMKSLKQLIILFIKFKFLTSVVFMAIQLTQTLFTLDLQTIVDNTYYAYCKATICSALLYIVYKLYLNGKRMKQLNSQYHHMFTLVILAISVALSYITLFICLTQEFDSPVIPILFSALFILIVLCINIYQRFIELTEQNVTSQFLLEQSKMTADYSSQIEHNLKTLHSLRHDIRNHLITIDGYASQENYASIQKYIREITNSYTDAPLFDTPSSCVSALLNTKYQLARQKNIDISIEWNFPYIHIDDFHLVTILGNLIDNAITATEKCEKGQITLSLIQQDSYLEIYIGNNHIEQIQEKDGYFKSTKGQDSFLHGLGIKNIRSTVEQLNGQINISYTKETFTVDILVPNY